MTINGIEEFQQAITHLQMAENLLNRPVSAYLSTAESPVTTNVMTAATRFGAEAYVPKVTTIIGMLNKCLIRELSRETITP